VILLSKESRSLGGDSDVGINWVSSSISEDIRSNGLFVGDSIFAVSSDSVLTRSNFAIPRA